MERGIRSVFFGAAGAALLLGCASATHVASIDATAQRAGAFISVTTYAASDTTVPWTHMRVFLLRDSEQLRGLSDALTAAGARVEPDSAKRRRQGEYSATLRDRVGASVLTIVR